MELDLRDLELLDALADHGTLTAAADHLHISQPALSQRLSKMEERLRTRLFDREGRRLLANQAGRRMLVAARQILTELESAERDVHEIRDGRDRRVRFTAQCSTALQWLPPLIRQFRQSHPGVEVRIEAVPGDEPIPALLADRIDVALVTKPDRRMDSVELALAFDDEMVAVVSVAHPWARRHHVTAGDFADAHLILYDIYDQTRMPATALPIPHGARPGRITTVPVITDLVIEMVAGGEGISVLPGWVAQPYRATHGINLVQIGAKPLTRTWYTAMRLGPKPPHVSAFARQLAAIGQTRQPPVPAD